MASLTHLGRELIDEIVQTTSISATPKRERASSVAKFLKRQIESGTEGYNTDGHNFRRKRVQSTEFTEWTELTQENLAEFDEMARKKGSALEPTTDSLLSSKTTSTTTSGFAI